MLHVPGEDAMPGRCSITVMPGKITVLVLALADYPEAPITTWHRPPRRPAPRQDRPRA